MIVWNYNKKKCWLEFGFLCCILIICGCDNKQDNNVQQQSSEINDNIVGVYKEINAYVNFSDGSSAPSGNVSPQNLNNGLSISVVSLLSPEMETAINYGEASVFVLCDGKIIKHAESPDEEPANVTLHSVKLFEYNEIHVYIPPVSDGGDDVSLLWICVNYFPDYIPLDGMGELSTLVMWYVPVYSSGLPKDLSIYNPSDMEYIYDKQPMMTDGSEFELPYVDIGIFNENYNSVSKLSMYDCAEVNNEAQYCVSSFYLDDVDYYLTVLINGEPVPFFDNNFSLKANCESGKRMLKYNVDKSFFAKNGVYSCQVIALPSKPLSNGNISKESSSVRHRVTVSLD